MTAIATAVEAPAQGSNPTSTLPTVRFSTATATVSESAGTVSIALGLTGAATTASTVLVSVVPSMSTATAGTDFTLAAPVTVSFPANATTQTLTIPISNDVLAEDAEYFTLRLSPSASAKVDRANAEMLVYIKDNDRTAPTQSRNLRLSLLGSYQNGVSYSGGRQINSAEIVAHDPSTQRLYVANSIGGKLDVLNFANPAAITPIASINISSYGGINSVTARNGVVACAIENTANGANNGFVVFFNANGVFQKQVTVGNLPDMITFSPDGRYLITANEGQPADNYAYDPEGSVSVIDFSNGLTGVTQASVSTVGFTGYNSQAATLRASGIRIYGGTAATPSTVAQDLEPEYVAVSADSRTAYITCQENNALAVLDLTTKQFTALRPLGFQNHNLAGFGLDASDRTADVLIAPWPVKGMRQPDAIARFTLPGNPTEYLIHVNEGDAREYSALTEQVRIGDAGYVLDTLAFPSHRLLKQANVLGRLRATNRLGDTDGDGDFDEIYTYGSRSFTIQTASTGAIIHDSGDMLERLTSTDVTFGPIFNASTDPNMATVPVRKDRSDDKGPEPEGVAIGTIRDTVYAFVSMERVGGAAVFNINDPANPRLVQYVNNRSTTTGAGDQGPEGTVFISAANSPTGHNLLLLANEISSTVAVYDIGLRGTTITATTAARFAAPLQLYPNPTQGGSVRLNRPVSGQLLNMLGQPMRQLHDAEQFETTGLATGIYLLKAHDGATAKLVVR